MGLGAEELKDILEKHRKWSRSEEGGQRADLQGADLRGADLRGAYLRGAYLRGAYLRGAYLRGADLQGADLRGADLRGAYLRGADLRGADLQGAYLRGAYLQGADLRGADLQGADLRGADLQGANLQSIKDDFFKRLEFAKAEAAGLYDYLMRGKIHGTSYSGECACFVGTVANIRKENYEHLSNGLEPDSDSPTEVWFMAIRQGDTPESNAVSAITKEWLEEFMKANEIAIPKYRLISSAENPELFP